MSLQTLNGIEVSELDETGSYQFSRFDEQAAVYWTQHFSILDLNHYLLRHRTK